jgi:hypothetical protein
LQKSLPEVTSSSIFGGFLSTLFIGELVGAIWFCVEIRFDPNLSKSNPCR